MKELNLKEVVILLNRDLKKRLPKGQQKGNQTKKASTINTSQSAVARTPLNTTEKHIYSTDNIDGLGSPNNTLQNMPELGDHLFTNDPIEVEVIKKDIIEEEEKKDEDIDNEDVEESPKKKSSAKKRQSKTKPPSKKARTDKTEKEDKSSEVVPLSRLRRKK